MTKKACPPQEINEFTQAARIYRSMSEREKGWLADNIAESLLFVEDPVRETILGYFEKVDPALGKILRKRFTF